MATGGIGGHVVRQALEAGQQVTADVMDPAAIADFLLKAVDDDTFSRFPVLIAG